jgi:hypothetical protein
MEKAGRERTPTRGLDGQLTHDGVAGEHPDLRDLRPAVMRLA